MQPPSTASGLARDWIDPQTVTVDPAFQTAIGGHELVSQILYRRGIRDLLAANAFLHPEHYQPAKSSAFADMGLACDRIEYAIRAQESIWVWGDFDVDGQTSTTLLVSALRGLGAQVQYHIPVRAHESHGVNIEYLRPIIAAGARLIVTCDTGISSHEALAYAQEQGVEVILTDHHDLPEVLPPAFATINPKMLPTGHALGSLPGVGTAYLLAKALYERAGRAAEADNFLDLVALGIVADVATLTGDTRYLLQRGLDVLRQTRRLGLQALFEMAKLQPAYLTEEHIGFVIGPRMNALGRLDDANSIVEFLTTEDVGRARILATHLEGLNARRRLLTAQVLRAAQMQIEKDHSIVEQAVIVLAHPEWPAGIIGIVASEISERYHRPTIMLAAPEGQPARGSARSIAGINITEAIAAQKDLLLGFGGHPMAAGLSMDGQNLTTFRRRICQYVEKTQAGALPRPTLQIDGYLTLRDLSLDLVSEFDRLAPFGQGNPPLVMAIPRLRIINASPIGRDGSHLQVMVKDETDQMQKVVWWGGADWPQPEGMFHLACAVHASNFRGQRDVQIEWVDAFPVTDQPIHLRRVRTIIDQRGLEHPLPILQALLSDSPSALIWGEAEAGEHIPALDRTRLTTADTMIIWTTPPGRTELEEALEAVHPQTVFLFCVEPRDQSLEGFLKRLAGLVKFAMQSPQDAVSLQRLAAAAAQRPETVKRGLQWLERRGMVQCIWLNHDQIQLLPFAKDKPAEHVSAENAARQKVNLETVETLQKQMRLLLEETAAYRRYFQTTEKDFLL